MRLRFKLARPAPDLLIAARPFGLVICTVSQQLQDFVATKFDSAMRIKSLEARGGGDYLFLSVAAGLVPMLDIGGQATHHVLQTSQQATLVGPRRTLLCLLLHLSAMGRDAWGPEDQLNFSIATPLDEPLVHGKKAAVSKSC